MLKCYRLKCCQKPNLILNFTQICFIYLVFVLTLDLIIYCCGKLK